MCLSVRVCVKNGNMITNISTTNIDKTHNIYAARAYMILVIICLFMLLRKYEYFMNKNMF